VGGPAADTNQATFQSRLQNSEPKEVGSEQRASERLCGSKRGSREGQNQPSEPLYSLEQTCSHDKFVDSRSGEAYDPESEFQS
jgi:hypothetical protein